MIRRSRWLEFAALGIILVVAAWLRWNGLAWDSGYLFHPDERQIVLVVSNLRLPANLPEIFSPASPLNPKFFAYGSFPIYLLRVLQPFAPPTEIVGPWSDDQLARWVLLGRWLSGLFDLGTIVLTYALGRRVYSARIGLFAAACVAVSVLHIQLAHFYTVDSLLAFFCIATLYAAFSLARIPRLSEASPARVLRFSEPAKPSQSLPPLSKKWLVLSGILFGLALATKITAAPLIAPIFYACCRATNAPTLKFSRTRFLEIWRAVRRPLLQITGIALLVFVATQPYILIDWYGFGRDVLREMFVARGWFDYPYTRQFAGTIPVVYQVAQSSIWGMGLPLGVFAWGGGALFLYQWWKTRDGRDTFLLLFALIYFLTIAFQLAKYLRYLLPLLPVLYIVAACAWWRVLEKRRVPAYALMFAILAASFLYSLAFVQIYARTHPWLIASQWIYENIPAGKTLTVEEWDDALPTMIQFPNAARRGGEYTQLVLHLYDDDTDAKRAALADALSQADAVIVASQRLYGSIGRSAARYPLTNRYYEKLFSGGLGFIPVMTTRNDPTVWGAAIRDNPFANLPFDVSRVNALLPTETLRVWDWGFADESFSVYDHPQPIIFQKARAMSAEEISKILQP